MDQEKIDVICPRCQATWRIKRKRLRLPTTCAKCRSIVQMNPVAEFAERPVRGESQSEKERAASPKSSPDHTEPKRDRPVQNGSQETKQERELRPAWRNQWLLIACLPFILLAVLGASLDGPAAAVRSNDPDGLLSLFVWLVLIAAMAILLYRRYSWKFTIDGVRVSSHNGIIARNQKAVRIKDLRSVELQQGVIDRLLNIGGLAFYSSGSANAEVLFLGIENPDIVRDDIQSLLDEMSGDR